MATQKASLLLLSSLLLACTAASAALREEQLDLPVTVFNAYGKRIDHTLKVTVFSDDANSRPAPVIVINHGRAGEPQERADLGRARYAETSKFLVQRGFIVAVPTRIGYGVTGGEDVEDSDPCDRKNYSAGFSVASEQIVAVLEAVQRRPDAAKDRAAVIGQSYGGAASLAVASLNPPGVKAVINFAGGSGGNPKSRPMRPCSPQQLERVFRDYGKTARVPTLWIYTENDQYFGPTHPRKWFDGFVKAGGSAEFVQFPPIGEDGHQLFNLYPEVWKPKVVAFLEAQGFSAPAMKASK